MVAWFLGLDDVPSWLLVEGKRDTTTVDINAIALLRQAIGSSAGRNTGTASPESIYGNSIDKHVDIVVDDEVLYKLISMVEKNEWFDELMIAMVDTKQSLTEYDVEEHLEILYSLELAAWSGQWYRIFIKGQKQRQNGQNRAQDWKSMRNRSQERIHL
ncbi:hypothetical protein Tco_0854862 [Tanacetum coccineum]